MFLKLLKYEFQAIRKWYLLINAILIIVAPILGSIVRETSPLLNYLDDEPHTQNLLWIPSTFFLVGLIFFLIFSTQFVNIVKRFYQNVFGQEGYLTLTLPVNSHQLILSKLVTATVLSIFNYFVVTLSITFIFTPLENIKPFAAIINSFSLLSYSMGLDITLTVLATIVTVVSNILYCYLAVSIGQLFSNRRGLLGVVFYFLILLFFSFINAFLSPFGIDSNNIIVNIIYAVIAYIATNYIISKKLNIQ
ncbi:MAG: hypothetical protein Q4A90_09625 [Streptococcus sp.]|nr:hypothetical protein [Streptococcus sp.]